MYREYFKSAMICSASADSIGWIKEFIRKIPEELKDVDVCEFHDWGCLMGGFYWAHYEPVGRGEYSDDTQLRIATLRALTYDNWWSAFAKYELPVWLLYQRGGGNACKANATLLSNGKYPWKLPINPAENPYYSNGGNGCVMRMLPFLFKYHENLEDLLENAVRGTFLTHGHPVAIIGTLYNALMLYKVFRMKIEGTENKQLELIEFLNGHRGIVRNYIEKAVISEYVPSDYKDAYKKMWNETLEIAESNLDYVIESYGKSVPTDKIFEVLGAKGNTKGSAVACVMSMLHLYLNYELLDCIRIPSNTLDIDTDTVATMVAGLCGLEYKLSELPEWMMDVQDCDYMLSLVDRLLDEPRTLEEQSINTTKLKKSIVQCREVTVFDNLPSVGQIEVRGSRKLETTFQNRIVVQFLAYIDGKQRVYIKHYCNKK